MVVIVPRSARRCSMVTLARTATVLAILAAPAAAQRLPDEVRPAARLRLTSAGRRVVGSVLTVSADGTTLTLDCWHHRGPPCNGPIPLSAIDSLDVSVGNRVVEGFGQGLVYGLFLGVGMALLSSDDEYSGLWVLMMPMITIPLGTLYGAGSLKWRPLYRRPAAAGPPGI